MVRYSGDDTVVVVPPVHLPAILSLLVPMSSDKLN